MKSAQIIAIHSLSISFASACKVVSDAQKDGTVEASRANANGSALKVSSVHVSDTSKMTPENVTLLKATVKRYNAGHALQTAFGIKLAQVGDLAAFAKQYAEDATPANVEPITSEAPAATVTKPAKKEKAA